MKNQEFDQFIEVDHEEVPDKAVLEFFIENNEVSGYNHYFIFINHLSFLY